MNVAEFGAKGDGFSDDTDALQTALNHIVAHGGTLELTSRKYLTRPLSVTRLGDTLPPFSIKGNGCNFRIPVADVGGIAGTTLQYCGGFGGTILTLKNLNGGTIEGLNFDGGTQAATGVLTDTALGVEFRNLHVTGTSGYGLVFQAGSAGFYHNNLYNLGTSATCAGGMLLTTANPNADVANCRFFGTSLNYCGTMAGLDLAAADNVQFFGVCINGRAALGPLVHFRKPEDGRFGAGWVQIYGLDGDNHPIRHDSPMSNMIVGLSHGNGIPGAIIGEHPERLTKIGEM